MHPVSRIMPLANVEVAVEEELMPPPACRSPATLSPLLNVEEAVELNPANDEKPVELSPPEKVEVELSPLTVVVAVEPM